ncbi:MAG: EutN/CcmL family microcompartment protein [Bacteroidales bacterium]|nr:EutN/CcmL family microcompartment protein [Bacteroidales bacterium]
MILGKVVGSVVSTDISIDIEGARYLLVQKCNQKGEAKSDFLVALDLVSAGYNEIVMISESTSARETTLTQNKPVDAIIVGIIDMIDENNEIVYRK